MLCGITLGDATACERKQAESQQHAACRSSTISELFEKSAAWANGIVEEKPTGANRPRKHKTVAPPLLIVGLVALTAVLGLTYVGWARTRAVVGAIRAAPGDFHGHVAGSRPLFTVDEPLLPMQISTEATPLASRSTHEVATTPQVALESERRVAASSAQPEETILFGNDASMHSDKEQFRGGSRAGGTGHARAGGSGRLKSHVETRTRIKSNCKTRPKARRRAKKGAKKRAKKGPAGRARALTADIIVRAVNRQHRSLTPCLRKARAKGKVERRWPNVILNWTIQPDGSLRSPAVIGPSAVLGTSLSACFAAKMKRWRFPSPKEPTPVRNFPLLRAVR